MNFSRRIFVLLAVGAVGVGLAWSVARGGGPSRPETLVGRLPDVPSPRASSMMLPSPRLARMSNSPVALASGGRTKTATLPDGEQLSAWLRGGMPLPNLGQIEPRRRGDAERTAENERKSTRVK